MNSKILSVITTLIVFSPMFAHAKRSLAHAAEVERRRKEAQMDALIEMATFAGLTFLLLVFLFLVTLYLSSRAEQRN